MAMATASKTTKGRSRLVEKETKQVLHKRSVELAGIGLLIVATAFFTMLWSYNPEDPSFFSATTEPAQNALGLFGASIADPLYRVLGWASYGIPVALAVWGLRLILHRGEDRLARRLVFIPIAVAGSAVFASAHVPLDDWPHYYGLGGLFGDAVLGEILGVLPFPQIVALRIATLALGVVFIALTWLALGVSMSETRAFFHSTKMGLILGWDWVITALGFVGSKSLRSAAAASEKARQASEGMRAKAEQARQEKLARQALEEEEAAADERTAYAAEAEIVESVAEEIAPVETVQVRQKPESEMTPEERMMARITAAVQARKGSEPGAASPENPAPLGGVTRDYDGPTAIVRSGQNEYEDEEPILEPAVERTGPRVQNTGPKKVTKSKRAQSEEQPSLLGEGREGYQAPPLSLLSGPGVVQRPVLSDDALEENARMLENVLDDYGVKGEIVSVRPGPVVTMYELEPAPGVKASRVIGLSDDIARSMSALAARVSTVPGRSVIGIELPNESRETVMLREILSSKSYGDGSHALPLALGKDIAGDPVVANLARMPHLLIAGTTGSGKSVAINTMILSLLYSLTPEQCRLIMIDPKMLELSVYDGIPHLLSPVVTDPKKAVVALKWVVAEMEERYRKMSKLGVRNIDGFNARVDEALKKGEAFKRSVQTGFDDETGDPIFETEEYEPEKMPFIVVIVDEMADLMMVAGKEIEACIQRLAQMARASGIHIVMATQRPSVDVITGTIKANFPTRISFQVTSKVDSRTILGEMGAEQLLGQGDMLYMAGGGKITRVHGPFVSDEEVEEVVSFLKSQGEPEYVSGVQEGPTTEEAGDIDMVLGLGGNTTGEDALYDQAVAIVAKDRKCSTSYIQRKLAIGYNKAARLVEQMEEEGVVSSANQVGKREILIPER
jgi:DNA segregation ATPase FtsK/SpoIIIE, S-DNA-T family